MANHRRLAWDGWFSLVLPGRWEMSEQAAVISLYDPRGGVGALQISLARRTRPSPVGLDEASDLAIQFARQKGCQAIERVSEFMCDGSPASYSEFVEEGEETTLWRVWHLMDRTRVALVTYNCALGSESVEGAACEEVLDSFRWLPAA